MKKSCDNYLWIELMNSKPVYIYKKGNDLVVKYEAISFNYTPETFNFSIDKPILKITIIQDKYGSVFRTIFDKSYFKAAVIIQQQWRSIKA